MTDLDAIDGLAGMLDTTATQLAAAAREVDDWARNHAPSPAARMHAQLVAGDMGAAAALLRQACDYAQALDLDA